MPGRQLANKWLKTEALLSDAMVAGHIPQTKKFNADNLRHMLSVYGMVVIKPVVGGGGYGVIKVSKKGDMYSYTYLSHKRSFQGFERLFHSLARVKKKRGYIIQQGIHLATIQGRPIDYRVKYVKTEGRWVFRSMLGRLARKGLFVTNLCKGGTMIRFAPAVRHSFSKAMVKPKRNEMRILTRKCTEILEARFPGIGELGFDYGIDRSGKVWIIEVNTRPQ
ncbi:MULTISPECIES: YheC/YheD family protein [unclassified Paenibacillus]|uniref:YheC/YheD family protein n=1 Tax=unclassified Paenibacillus TaxID=185978 RepID=UPI001C0F9166|nr:MULTISPECIES: YheC/YheD family protein [unclassified Paenibacillus]MBU5441474.1 YheC/YheD family protein [Paenibacillus sp. MSJ-34]CAH0118344.1 Endospore coat-associated protein YheD [Paenibacillus sp. CECT 9249]